MCNQNVLPLSLNGDTFNALKSDFDTILRNTLSNMELKGADAAEMNIKLKISLTKDQTRDFEACYDGAMRDIVKPKFEHAVQSVLQIKDKKDGTLSGNYELVWDKEAQKYVMREITDGQTTLFDNEKTAGSTNFVDAEYTVIDNGQPALQGRKVALLPAPADDSEKDSKVDDGAFEWLRQFIGASMRVLESMGIYTVRTADNKVILSSASGPDTPFYCPVENLAPHVGHEVVCVAYGDEEDLANISIECEECGEVLFDINAPEIDEEVGCVESYGEPEDGDGGDHLEDGSCEGEPAVEEGGESGYEYEEPGNKEAV